MDRSSSDGVDSADDSGSSQPYPSTLQGIPKLCLGVEGIFHFMTWFSLLMEDSARQVFRKLQEPIVEDTIKSHFEKIILIGQKPNLQKKQDLRPIAGVHGSLVAALSQVIPNNVNGGILTPLDLCDTVSNQDLSSLGYLVPHASGLASSNQGVVPTLHPPNGLNSSHQGVQGSLRTSIGNNLAASSSQFNSPRSLSHRPGPLSVDEKQSIQQYNHLVAGRNIQPGSFSPSGGGRIQPSGNGVGLMTGMTQSMAVPRPGHSGITSSMLNSGSMMPTNMNMHSGAASGHRNFMLRSCDALQMVQVKSREQKLQPCGWKQDLPVHGYAVRFLQFNCSSAPPCLKVEGSGIPDIGSDIDLPDVLWPDQLTEVRLVGIEHEFDIFLFLSIHNLCM